MMAVVTNTVKKNNNLPLQDPNNPNAPMQIVQPQQPDSNAVQGAANQSSMQINKMAQQGFSSPTIQATSQQTQELLKDPTQGQNYQQNINTRLAQQDRERAQAVETARQGLAGMSGSSLNQNALVDIALKGAEQRSDLQTQLESEAAQAKQDAIYKALAEGRATSGTELGAYESNINALSKAIGATDIERQAAATAKESATTRNWQAEQNELDRQAQVALQSGDIQGQKEIEQLKSKLTLDQMASEQNWQGIQNQLNRDAQIALQSNDINAVRNNLLTQLDYDKQAQASGQQFTAEQNALNRTLETTLKSLDINSAKELTELKGKIDSGMLTKEQDWKTVQNSLDRAAAEALQSGDIKGQLQIAQLKGEIEKQAQAAQQTWQTAERVASQAYNTTERLSTQDYESAEKYLDRQAETSKQMQDYYNNLNLQSNEFSQEKTMADINSQLEEARANNDYQRTSALTRLQSSLQSGLQDDAQEAAKELAQMEENNQRYMQDKQAALQLNMQTQGFNQEERMAYIDAQLQTAKDVNDVNLQKQIMQYQSMLDFDARSQEAGNEQAMLRLKSELDTALQNNDFVHAEALQKARLDKEAEQAALDRYIDQARVDLESKQVDMQQIDQDYQRVAELVATGKLDPAAQYEFVTKTLQAHGVDTSGYDLVNAEEAAKKALNHEFEMQKQQFMQTHPEYTTQTVWNINGKNVTFDDIVKQNGMQDLPEQSMERYKQSIINTYGQPKTITGELSPEGQKALNEFINSAIYGELSEADKKAKETAGYLKAEDLSVAAKGDKFAFDEPVSYNGQTIPPGKYTVDKDQQTTGSKFWGTQRDVETYYLVGEDGTNYRIGETKSGTKGNIISGLWADE
jgi:hypothetical protein